MTVRAYGRAAGTGTVPADAAGIKAVHRSPSAARVALALGRVEVRRMVLTPAILAVIALVALVGSPVSLWPEVAYLPVHTIDVAFAVLPIAAAALIGSTYAALRSRRDGTDELFASMPARPQARTAAHLMAPFVMVVAAVALTATSLLAAWRLRDGFGPVDGAEFAVGPLLVIGAGALGVLLARWVRSMIAAVVACLGIAVFELSVNSLPPVNPLRRLAFWAQSGDMPLDLLPARLARWHLVFLVGLIAMAAVGAVARHGLNRGVVVAGVAAIAVVATSVWFQSRPVTAAAWASRNALLERPQDHQVCEVRDGVRYCAYPAYRSLVDFWARPVDGVRGAVPAGRWPAGLEVSQRVAPQDRMYADHPAVNRALPALVTKDSPGQDDGRLHPPILWDTTGRAEFGLALLAAARTVGLPVPSPAPVERCDASGQARAVVALWLAGQATPGTATTLRRLSREGLVDVGGRPFLVIPDFGTAGGVAYGDTEVALALRLLGRPVDDAGSWWDELTDPATPTVVAVARLGLDGVGSAPLGRGGPDFTRFSSQEDGPPPRLGGVCR